MLIPRLSKYSGIGAPGASYPGNPSEYVTSGAFCGLQTSHMYVDPEQTMPQFKYTHRNTPSYCCWSSTAAFGPYQTYGT